MGKNWAISIGINQYDNLQPLNFAKRDAEAMAAWFREEAKFDQVFLFTADSPPIPANTPIPTQPIYGRVRRFLQAQFEQPLLKPEDNLWFFFAGHGMRHADKDYLMLADSDPGAIEQTAISVEYITERLRRSRADNVVLLLDACREESSRSGLGIGEEKHQGVITFYSCAAKEKSWEIAELQHGSFTHTLLAGLRLHGEANCATVERLDRYLNSYVPQLNSRYQKPRQNPYLKAEWEYACRAGTTTPFHFGETITTDLANYNGTYTYASEAKGKYLERTTDVGSFPPNAFGLYDMHGNVWEWCQDDWHDNYIDAPKDGSVWTSQSGNNKLLRGGSWDGNPRNCRSACRGYLNLVYYYGNIGFRVVCSGAART